MRFIASFLLLIICCTLHAQQKAIIQINANKQGARVSKDLHGIFFEEISHGGEGGLYAELIQNRGFEDAQLPYRTSLENGFIIPERTPHFSLKNNEVSDWKMEWNITSPFPAWTIDSLHLKGMSVSINEDYPLSAESPHSLHIEITDRNNLHRIYNEGFWGIHVLKGEVYELSFWSRTNKYKGAITVSLISSHGAILATEKINSVESSQWKQHTATLKAIASDPKARFMMSFENSGEIWLDMVSLFPAKTFKNRKNGLRNDLATYLTDLKPAFVRWPGGCFVEGISIHNTPSWKHSIGPIEKRKPTYSPWGYWSSNGFGYHEFLQFCEDINASALYVFNAGVSCDFRSGTFITDDNLDSVINDALDAIEYAVGPADSKWGRVRARNGHQEPFPLKYVEVGNEQVGPRYAARYNRFYDAIHKKYPKLKIIASMGIGDVNKYTLDSMKTVQVADEHAYKGAYWSMRNTTHFDKYPRGQWDMYVGEYATNNGVGAGNMLAALSDAVYIMSMERNSELVKMSSYAPLLVNVNDVDWPVNLINFDASKSFARISYYVIKLFNEHRASYNLPTGVSVIKPGNTTPQFSGGIGLATWDTHAEYKDLQVIENGKLVYQSDFKNNAGEWNSVLGEWKSSDSSIAQVAMGPQRLAVLNGRTFSEFTLKVKARKTSDETNAFIIAFGVKDNKTMMRAHIGSWINQNAVLESVTNGMEVIDLMPQVKLKEKIQKNRWYDIRIEVGAEKVEVFLDDQLLLTYTGFEKIFSIAGRADNGEIIVKTVNATDQPVEAALDIKGLNPSKATMFTISSDKLEDEHSFEFPQKYTPVQKKIQLDAKPVIVLPPFSISVIRIQQ